VPSHFWRDRVIGADGFRERLAMGSAVDHHLNWTNGAFESI
jgi:hypothetical protein